MVADVRGRVRQRNVYSAGDHWFWVPVVAPTFGGLLGSLCYSYLLRKPRAGCESQRANFLLSIHNPPLLCSTYEPFYLMYLLPAVRCCGCALLRLCRGHPPPAICSHSTGILSTLLASDSLHQREAAIAKAVAVLRRGDQCHGPA